MERMFVVEHLSTSAGSQWLVCAQEQAQQLVKQSGPLIGYGEQLQMDVAVHTAVGFTL